MDKKQRILWGGATASSQYEGGFTDSKAASIIRLETGQKVLNIWKKILNT